MPFVTGATLCNTMGPIGDPVPSLSGAGNVCFWAVVSSGDTVPSPSSPGTQTHSHALCSGLQVPPRCPKTGLEPLTLEKAARWSSGAPPPLGFQNADWPAGQPIPHHAPWESSRSVPSSSRISFGDGGDERCLDLGAQDLHHSPSATVSGSSGRHFSLLVSVHSNLSLSASLWGETIT